MLAKIWKKVLLIILIIACLVNIAIKLTKIDSFNVAMEQVKNSIYAIVQKD